MFGSGKIMNLRLTDKLKFSETKEIEFLIEEAVNNARENIIDKIIKNKEYNRTDVVEPVGKQEFEEGYKNFISFINSRKEEEVVDGEVGEEGVEDEEDEEYEEERRQYLNKKDNDEDVEFTEEEFEEIEESENDENDEIDKKNN
jgi:hypothetical protein